VAPSLQGEDFTEFQATFEAVVGNVEKAIQGKREVIRLALVTLLAEGHLLLEDVPGVGKTMLAKSVARSISADWSRIQFTPDLLPSDVTGVNVWDRSSQGFEFKSGAVFSNIVLGDEINRASPKTQSALLECMEERQVSVDGVTHRLAEPFMVIATQNPIEHEGTYPLPESQLDRFMMRLSVGYPTTGSELEILETHGNHSPLDDLEPVTDAEDVIRLVKMAREVYVAPSLRRYIVQITEATRGNRDIYLGASPRASLFLLRSARTLAASLGREFVVPDDVRDVAVPVLTHRLLPAPEAQMRGLAVEEILKSVLDQIPAPRRND
jgi:MoxR-like ATPase